jgi:acetyl esterase/lipase
MKNFVPADARRLTLNAISNGASLRRLLRISGSAPGRRLTLRCLIALALLLTVAGCCTIGHRGKGYLHAGKRQAWERVTGGERLTLRLFQPRNAPSNAPLPVVFYLHNLATKRAGWENDASIVRDFRAEGYLVVTVDFAKNTNARMPLINRDLGKLRDDLRAKKLLGDFNVDMAHVFVVPEGCRLKRDVVFYRDEGRTLAMDIIYPSKPKRPVGTVLEFSCDNKDRFGNFSLSVCSDTLLDGFATEGFAVAMADHPVAPPYKGLDPMPDCALKIKAAVRTLRAEGEKLGLNKKIVPIGFSRGSGMALMLVTTAGLTEFEGHGESAGVSSDVQGAVVMSGRFTYLDLLPDDKMLPRYAQAWGDRETNLDVWRRHGALDYLEPVTMSLRATNQFSLSPSEGERDRGRGAGVQPATSGAGQEQAPPPAPHPGPLPFRRGEGEDTALRAMKIPPLFLTINCTESPDALHQMEVLRKRLEAAGSKFAFHLDTEPRGHKVTLDPVILSAMRDYLRERLK